MAYATLVIDQLLCLNGELSLKIPSLIETLLEKRHGNCAKVHFICRFFFVVMFIMVFAFSIYFITNVWIKWSASPMIITLGAMSTSIRDFPFPGNFDFKCSSIEFLKLYLDFLIAVTLCNMNQAKKSAVQIIPFDSVEYSLVQSLCGQRVEDNVTNTKSGKWNEFQNVLMKVK